MFLLVEILLKSAIANHKSKVFAPLAQLAEQVTLNHWVAGSSPARCISSLSSKNLRSLLNTITKRKNCDTLIEVYLRQNLVRAKPCDVIVYRRRDNELVHGRLFREFLQAGMNCLTRTDEGAFQHC